MNRVSARPVHDRRCAVRRAGQDGHLVVVRSLSLFEQASNPWPSDRPPPEVMQAVQRSCRVVADRPVRLAEVFYQHLFEMAPATRAMFAVDMTEQMQKMTDTLLQATAQLLTFDTAELEVVLHQMGRDHYARYRVEPEHYTYVAHALTRAVREVAGWEYTSYLSSCWIALSQRVTRYMVAGAQTAKNEVAHAERGDTQYEGSATIPKPRSMSAGSPIASTRSSGLQRSLMGRIRS